MAATTDQKMLGIDDGLQGAASKSELRSNVDPTVRIKNVVSYKQYTDSSLVKHVLADALCPTDPVPTTLAGMTALGYDGFGIGSQVRFSAGKLAIKTAVEGVAGWNMHTGTALS